MAELKKGARITGPDRAKLTTEITTQYLNGASIRNLAQEHGRSYGFMHRLLSESGAPLRVRGGRAKVKPTA